jgi:hypothetical protein
VVVGSSRDFFAATAGCAAALVGLLFVAMSVAPASRRRGVIQQVRAAAALLSFLNALAVSLFALVPDNTIGWPALAFGISGVLFTVAGLRSIIGDPVGRRRLRRQAGLVGLLLAAFGAQLVAAILVLRNPGSHTAVNTVANALVASLLIGVARSWELVGDRDTGIFTSIAALAGRERQLSDVLAGDDRHGPEDPARPADPDPGPR